VALHNLDFILGEAVEQMDYLANRPVSVVELVFQQADAVRTPLVFVP